MVRLKIFDPGMQKKMKQKIQDLLRRGIIHLSNSLYLINISVVEKKDRTIRIYLALIDLNATIIDDKQPLSNMRKLMNAIVRAKFYFS